MAKVLRTRTVAVGKLVDQVAEEIILLTNSVPCRECVEILIESCLFHDLMAQPDIDKLKPFTDNPHAATIMGFKFRVVHGPGVRPGSLAVITRTEILFK